MKMPLVEGCKEYSQTSPSFLDDKFVCTKCDNDLFYLNVATNKCIKRTVLSKSCLSYKKTDN